MEIYVPDKWAQQFNIQPGYYEIVVDVIDALRKAGPANLTDVVTCDDTSKRVTVRCAEGAILELRGDIARMSGFLNNTKIRAFDKKRFYPCLTRNWKYCNIFTFIQILSRVNIMVMLLFPFFVLLQ